MLTAPAATMPTGHRCRDARAAQRPASVGEVLPLWRGGVFGQPRGDLAADRRRSRGRRLWCSPVPPSDRIWSRATDETARFICTQLELADLDESRADLARAEIRALRAQISPHFIYNALTTISAFIRSDPDRAGERLLEFADFTRYSYRQAGEFTTLADEMGNIEKYRVFGLTGLQGSGWRPA